MKDWPRVGFIFLALLIASVMSYGPYVMMVGILLLAAICISMSSTRACLFNKRNACIAFASIAVISCFYLYALIVPHPQGAAPLEKSLTNNYLFLILVVIFLFSFRALFHTHLKDVTDVLGALLVFNAVILLIQTVMLAVTHQYIDLVHPVTGVESRYRNYANLNPFFAYRPTGLFVEPSEFSAAIDAMAIGYVILSRALGRRPNNHVIGLTILCMLITQSTAAIIQSGILLLAVVLLQRPKTKLWFLACIALALIASPGLLMRYTDSFVLKYDATSGIRLALLDYIYHARQGWDYWIGFGPFSVEASLYTMATSDPDAPVASLNDAGLLNYFVVQFGIIGLAVPACMFLRMRKNLTTVLFFAALMTSKLSYTYPALYYGLLPLLIVLPEPKEPAASEVHELMSVSRGRHAPDV
ncbi:hypothetical protein LMG28140_01669 [Paraburkholderia metrosideri]|uniref:O-antigen polymerase n=2 Tax=Paraburkholderia metrosideri TaxID=580937 RepID=A0ABN7HMI6_9BURK|nr:hypothetical protein LMG28140_01669 [Paraburkholderia metrosideri]